MCFQVDFLYARSGTLQIFSLLTYSLFFERMTREELRNVKRLPKMPWCLAVMRCKHFAWHSRWVRQVRWFTQPGKGLGRKRLLVKVSERIERYSQLEWSRQELKVAWFDLICSMNSSNLSHLSQVTCSTDGQVAIWAPPGRFRKITKLQAWLFHQAVEHFDFQI